MAEERFRGLRLEIATVLYGRWLTLYQAARLLGKRSGDIQRSLRALHAEGVVECEDEEPERGSRFRLAEEFEQALAEALRADQIPGLMEPDQDFLVLEAPSRRALDTALSRGDVAAAISWAARLGSGTSMLLAIAPKASEGDYGRLLSVLEDGGIEFTSHRTAAVSDGRALRAVAVASAEALAVAGGGEL